MARIGGFERVSRAPVSGMCRVSSTGKSGELKTWKSRVIPYFFTSFPVNSISIYSS